MLLFSIEFLRFALTVVHILILIKKTGNAYTNVNCFNL